MVGCSKNPTVKNINGTWNIINVNQTTDSAGIILFNTDYSNTSSNFTFNKDNTFTSKYNGVTESGTFEIVAEKQIKTKLPGSSLSTTYDILNFNCNDMQLKLPVVISADKTTYYTYSFIKE